MRYYVRNNGKVELTLTGQYVLTYLGLTLSDLREMTRNQLLEYIKKARGAIDTGEITQSSGHTPRRGDTGGLYEGGFGVIDREEQHFDDVGGASRYFDLDAWAEHHGFLDVPKPNKAERDFGLGRGFKKQVPKSKFNLSDGSKDMRFDGVIPTPRRNTHPTVKPIKLMAYLIELGCPPGGVVLDPFVGSGTTCIAAKQLTRRYIGIEIDEEYCRIAEARIAAYPQPLEWFGDVQTSKSKEDEP